MKEGRAGAVKLEGGEEILPQVEAIVKASIPVMGHLGLTPQSINALGGYKAQGRDIASAKKLIRDAKLLEEAGAFSVVLECVPADLATYVSEQLSIPTIGIGGGAGTDGQILVYADMLAMFSDYRPKFVKNFANVGDEMRKGFKGYVDEVKNSSYPAAEHGYTIDSEIMEEIKKSES
jgi:3-methyl-2-oxobutanoate hydroxymethyltransferase